MFRNFNDQRRTAETPMDWEWQTEGGPRDPNSAFPQLKPGQGQRSGFGDSSPRANSPFKSTPAATPFRNPSFTTPRKPFDDHLYSEASGAESSPADNADAEDTPDQQGSTMTASFPNTTGTIKQPIFARYGAGFKGNSPGRAEQRRGKYGNALAQKARKRQRIVKDLSALGVRDDDSDSDSEEPKSRPKSRGKRNSGGGGNWFTSILDYIDSHPNLPNTLSFYAQMMISFVITTIFIMVVYTFWTTIRSDVEKARDIEIDALLGRRSVCAKEYADNRCGADNRIPVQNEPCHKWEECMHQDPSKIPRGRVSAATFAEIFNSFIEPISYKAMIFMVVIVSLSIFVNNVAFSSFRTKLNVPPPNPFFPPHPNQSFQWGPPPPQTPSNSQNNLGYDAYFSDQTTQAMMPIQTPIRSPSKGRGLEWK